MDSIFKICKSTNCGLTITGLELDNSEYLSETGNILVSTRNYAYSQSVTLNYIRSIDSNEDYKLQGYIIDTHINPIDESIITMPIDGLYEVAHLILPSEVWLQYVLDRNASALSIYNNIYIYNKSLDKFQKYSNSVLTDITLEEIIEFNAVPQTNVNDQTHTIIKSIKNVFGTCYINKCLYDISSSILSTLPKCINKLDPNLIHNRDIIWMTINVLKYLVEKQDLFEAQRILESVTKCNTMCNNTTSNINNINCGCNS